MSTNDSKKYFNDNIKPTLQQFSAEMMWRFNLAKYEDVYANRVAIYNQISSQPPGMPPAPLTPLSSQFIENFKTWMDMPAG